MQILLEDLVMAGHKSPQQIVLCSMRMDNIYKDEQSIVTLFIIMGKLNDNALHWP